MERERREEQYRDRERAQMQERERMHHERVERERNMERERIERNERERFERERMAQSGNSNIDDRRDVRLISGVAQPPSGFQRDNSAVPRGAPERER